MEHTGIHLLGHPFSSRRDYAAVIARAHETSLYKQRKKLDCTSWGTKEKAARIVESKRITLTLGDALMEMDSRLFTREENTATNKHFEDPA